MSEIILFRYHRDFAVCEQTLRQLKRLNPDLGIHGLYGGSPAEVLPTSLTDLLDSNWTVPSDDYFYKWRNGDLCARLWYQHIGRTLDFDHVYFLEWDMLFTRPLREVYGTLQQGANYATIFGDYRHALDIDWWWITGHYGRETSLLLSELSWRGAPVDLTALNFGNVGAAVFCRPFLDRYAREAVPSYSNDELRLSVYSRAYGIPLLDNGIKDRDALRGNIFHAEDSVLTRDDFDQFMAREGEVIHPLRFIVEGIDEMILP